MVDMQVPISCAHANLLINSWPSLDYEAQGATTESFILSGSLVLSAGQEVFDGCGISLISDVEILDRDRRALGLAYAPEASRRGEERGRTAVRSSSASLRAGQAGEMPSFDGLRQ
jgi:hypothetical protein